MKFKLKFKLINDLKRIYNKPISNLKISNLKLNRKTIIIIIILSIFLVFSISTFVLGGNKDQKIREVRKARQAELDVVLSNNQILDCTKCHVTGQSPFIAKDTINRSSSCYNCHREDIDFLADTNSKQVHKYHEGNTSILPGYPSGVDYSTRHKEILGDCSDCHVYQSGKPPECTRCHSGNHIEEKKGLCLNCHVNIDNLFRHDIIKLQTHNIFGNNSCRMCHSSDKIALELANGIRISITQSSNLCKQCHEGIYRDWKNGNHISSIECVICHNPHSPKNINQTILGIAKDITTEKNVEKPPVSEKEKESSGLVRQTYSYDNVGQ